MIDQRRDRNVAIIRDVDEIFVGGDAHERLAAAVQLFRNGGLVKLMRAPGAGDPLIALGQERRSIRADRLRRRRARGDMVDIVFLRRAGIGRRRVRVSDGRLARTAGKQRPEAKKRSGDASA